MGFRSEGALFERLGGRDLAEAHGPVSLDIIIDDFLNLSNLLGGHFLMVGEIESQTLRRNIGAALHDMVTEDEPEGLIHQVGGGVILCTNLIVIGEAAL